MARYLGNFNEFFEQRNLYNWVIFGDLFPKILEWHCIFFEKYNKYDAKYDKLFIALHEIESSLVQLVKKCVISSLQKNTSFLLFKNLKDHTKGKDIKILKELFGRSVCRPFFNNIFHSNDRYDIWNHYFPKEWKITKETLEEDGNIFSEIWIDGFFQWVPERIRSTGIEKDFDDSLDEVAKELFPSVEPMLWAELLTFLMRPRLNNELMKSLVERRPNFGSYRMFVSSRSDGQFKLEFNKAMDKQHQNTIELSILLFKDLFNKEKLQEFISDLKKLQYDDETMEESRRKYFISIFEEMLSLLETGKA